MTVKERKAVIQHNSSSEDETLMLGPDRSISCLILLADIGLLQILVLTYGSSICADMKKVFKSGSHALTSYSKR